MLHFDEDSVLPATIESNANEDGYAVAGCKVASYEMNITPAIIKFVGKVVFCMRIYFGGER